MARDFERRDMETIEARAREIYYRNLWLRADGRRPGKITLEDAEHQAAEELGLLKRYLKMKADRPPRRKRVWNGAGMARSRRGTDG